MVDYPLEVLGLINSLHNPRYNAQGPPSQVAILFDGILLNAKTTFLASPNDPHDYGIDVWNKAQKGIYGPIAPYTPAPPPPLTPVLPPDPAHGVDPGNPIPPPVDPSVFYAELMKQAVPNAVAGAAIEKAIAILDGNGGQVPDGARGRVFTDLAETWGLPLDDFMRFLFAFDTLRFAHQAALAKRIRKPPDEKHEAMTEFIVAMVNALEVYNEASPIKIVIPEPTS